MLFKNNSSNSDFCFGNVLGLNKLYINATSKGSDKIGVADNRINLLVSFCSKSLLILLYTCKAFLLPSFFEIFE